MQCGILLCALWDDATILKVSHFIKCPRQAPFGSARTYRGCSALHLGCAVTERVRARVLSWSLWVVWWPMQCSFVWVEMGVADDVPRRAEEHEADSEVGMGARDGADGHARVASDIGGGIGWVRDGCRLLRVRAVPPPMCSSMESCFVSLAIDRLASSFRMTITEAEDRPRERVSGGRKPTRTSVQLFGARARGPPAAISAV